MAALLNSLSFVFTNSFLPKYRVKYDYKVVEWDISRAVSREMLHFLASEELLRIRTIYSVFYIPPIGVIHRYDDTKFEH